MQERKRWQVAIAHSAAEYRVAGCGERGGGGEAQMTKQNCVIRLQWAQDRAASESERARDNNKKRSRKKVGNKTRGSLQGSRERGTGTGCTQQTGSVIELNGHSSAMCVPVWVNVNPLLHSKSKKKRAGSVEEKRHEEIQQRQQQPEKRYQPDQMAEA